MGACAMGYMLQTKKKNKKKNKEKVVNIGVHLEISCRFCG